MSPPPRVLLDRFDLIASDDRSVTAAFSTPDYASFVIMPAASTDLEMERCLAAQIAFGSEVRHELVRDVRAGYPGLSFASGIDAVASSARGSIAIWALDNPALASSAAIAAIRGRFSPEIPLIVAANGTGDVAAFRAAGIELFDARQNGIAALRDVLLDRLGRDVIAPARATFKLRRPSPGTAP